MQKCSVCDQSETFAGAWIFCDRGDGKQDVGFGTCPHCRLLSVCGDCLHERNCCDHVEEETPLLMGGEA